MNEHLNAASCAGPPEEPIPAPVRILYHAHRQEADRCAYCDRIFNRWVQIVGRMIKLRPERIHTPEGTPVTVCKPCAVWSRGIAGDAALVRTYLASRWQRAEPVEYECGSLDVEPVD